MNIKWNQIALGAAVGFLLGAAFSHFYMLHRFPGPPPFGRGGPHDPMEMFSRELGLTEPQKEKISVIFKKYEPEMKKAMSANPGLETVRERLKAEILPILTSEQAKKLELLEERMKSFRGAGHFRGPGPDDDFR